MIVARTRNCSSSSSSRATRAPAPFGASSWGRSRRSRPSAQGTSLVGGFGMDRVTSSTRRCGTRAVAGLPMNTMEKLEMARQLARLRVDVIEAGFRSRRRTTSRRRARWRARSGRSKARRPSAGSPAWRSATSTAAGGGEVRDEAAHPHVVATSDIHLKYKLRKSRAEILKAGEEAVKHARGYCDDVGSRPRTPRAPTSTTCARCGRGRLGGRRTINIADTVGYSIPADGASASRVSARPERHEGNYVLSCTVTMTSGKRWRTR